MEESQGLDSVVQTGKKDRDTVIVYCSRNRKGLHRRMQGAKSLPVIHYSVKKDTRNT